MLENTETTLIANSTTMVNDNSYTNKNKKHKKIRQIEEDESDSDNESIGLIKKRGRKPKGGKIISQHDIDNYQNIDLPSIILHINCQLNTKIKDSSLSVLGSYDILNKPSLCFDLATEDIKPLTDTTVNHNIIDSTTNKTCNCSFNATKLDKKLNQLKQQFYDNKILNHSSKCFWDTCEFTTSPIHIPIRNNNGMYEVYGHFCSPECAAAYLMNEHVDNSVKIERYQLLNYVYSNIYEYTNNITPAPDPRYLLQDYYGNLTIQEYRELLGNNRIIVTIQRPMTRKNPELYELNNDCILDNKFLIKKASNKGKTAHSNQGSTNQKSPLDLLKGN